MSVYYYEKNKKCVKSTYNDLVKMTFSFSSQDLLFLNLRRSESFSTLKAQAQLLFVFDRGSTKTYLPQRHVSFPISYS